MSAFAQGYNTILIGSNSRPGTVQESPYRPSHVTSAMVILRPRLETGLRRQTTEETSLRAAALRLGVSLPSRDMMRDDAGAADRRSR